MPFVQCLQTILERNQDIVREALEDESDVMMRIPELIEQYCVGGQPHDDQVGRILILTKATFEYKEVMLQALAQVASECGTVVKVSPGLNEGDLEWKVVIRGMRHTTDGRPVNANCTREITFTYGTGPGGRFWEFDIYDAEVKQQMVSPINAPSRFWARFGVTWSVDDKDMSIWMRRHENSWPEQGKRYTSDEDINDGTSYQGESTKLLDDLLLLVRKLPSMMTYERMCKQLHPKPPSTLTWPCATTGEGAAKRARTATD